MRPQRLVSIGLLLGTFAIAISQAENAALRKEIEGVYKKFDSYVAKGDMKSVLNMLDDSFIQVDVDGNTMNKAQMKNAIESMAKIVKDAKSKCVVNSVHEQGREVVAWITMKMDFKMKDGDKWVPVSYTGKFAETLVKTPQGWKFTYSQTLPD